MTTKSKEQLQRFAVFVWSMNKTISVSELDVCSLVLNVFSKKVKKFALLTRQSSNSCFLWTTVMIKDIATPSSLSVC